MPPQAVAGAEHRKADTWRSVKASSTSVPAETQRSPHIDGQTGGHPQVLRVASPWCDSLAPRDDRILLSCLLQAERPLEQRRRGGLRLPTAAPGLDRLLGHELSPGEQRLLRLRRLIVVSVAVAVDRNRRVAIPPVSSTGQAVCVLAVGGDQTQEGGSTDEYESARRLHAGGPIRQGVQRQAGCGPVRRGTAQGAQGLRRQERLRGRARVHRRGRERTNRR